MIKWNCDFKIPDSWIQTPVAYIKVVDFKVAHGPRTTVNLMMTGEDQDVVIKEYQKVFYNKALFSEQEIEYELLSEFEDAEIV